MVVAENIAEINEKIISGKMRVALPIIGVKQKLSEGVMGQIEKEVLAEEGINLENLKVNELSRVGGRGGLRTAITLIRDFKIQNISKNENGMDFQTKLSFMLLRGSYATVLLREIMKPIDPITAGF